MSERIWCDHGRHAVESVVECSEHASIDATRPLARGCFHCPSHGPASRTRGAA